MLLAWKEFLNDKRGRKDVRTFELRFADYIFDLHNSLKLSTYKHGSYLAFTINDPKKRDIHKARVKDRLLHHAIHRQLYPLYDRIFIAESYSCRDDKGIHKALDRFRYFFRKVSRNNTRTAWVLKCDVRKFFDSIDHEILIGILRSRIVDQNILTLLKNIIASFEKSSGKGIPLGNLTSQLFANVYIHEFDQFVKQTLKVKYYIRYADDFVFLSHSKTSLELLVPIIQKFLMQKLSLFLHPNKIFLKTFSSGVDFLGWVHFPTHRVLRKVTRKRMIEKLKHNQNPASIQSYKGLLSHGNTKKIVDEIEEL